MDQGELKLHRIGKHYRLVHATWSIKISETLRIPKEGRYSLKYNKNLRVYPLHPETVTCK